MPGYAIRSEYWLMAVLSKIWQVKWGMGKVWSCNGSIR